MVIYRTTLKAVLPIITALTYPNAIVERALKEPLSEPRFRRCLNLGSDDAWISVQAALGSRSIESLIEKLNETERIVNDY